MREREELKMAMLGARRLHHLWNRFGKMTHDGSMLLTEGNKRSENTWIMGFGDSTRDLGF